MCESCPFRNPAKHTPRFVAQLHDLSRQYDSIAVSLSPKTKGWRVGACHDVHTNPCIGYAEYNLKLAPATPVTAPDTPPALEAPNINDL